MPAGYHHLAKVEPSQVGGAPVRVLESCTAPVRRRGENGRESMGCVEDQNGRSEGRDSDCLAILNGLLVRGLWARDPPPPGGPLVGVTLPEGVSQSG